MSGNYLEEKLREDFLEALKSNPCGDVVDDLIAVLKRDYVLVLKERHYCKDCFNCNPCNYGLTDLLNDAYCKYYQRRMSSLTIANDCPHFLSGENEARKSIARLHCELTGDLIYDR